MPTVTPAALPNNDKRYKLLAVAVRKHGRDSRALIEILHTAQELFGYLSPELLWYAAKELDVPPSRVFGVASFYHFFSLAPQGRHGCTVCMGTACFVKRAAEVLTALEREFDVKSGGTTSDRALSLSVARCVGSCGLAPVVILDGQVQNHATPEGMKRAIHAALSQSQEAAP